MNTTRLLLNLGASERFKRDVLARALEDHSLASLA